MAFGTFDIMALLPWIIVAVVAVIVVLKIISWYRVVPPHQAHVVVTRSKGRKLYSSREGFKSSYFFIPFLQRRAIIPLENIKMEIEDIPLRDIDLAKFLADVRCYLNVSDPILASERLGKVETEEVEKGFPRIESDVKDLVQAITRNASMTMDVFTIMKERAKFSALVEVACNEELDEWGLRLIDLEVIHFEDQKPYTVIQDLESRQAKIISVETRKQVAEREKEAIVVEAVNNQEALSQKAESEKAYKIAQELKDQEVGKAQQAKIQAIAEATNLANAKAVEAKRTLDVGNEDVVKKVVITKAEGLAEAKMRDADGQAEYTRKTGQAGADVIRANAFAEAEGIDKKAEAQKKYNQAGAMAIEIIKSAIDASKDIEIAKYQHLGQALQKANVSVVSTGEKQMFGIPMGAEAGIALGGMFKALKDTGFDVEGILSGIGSTLKDIMGKKGE